MGKEWGLRCKEMGKEWRLRCKEMGRGREEQKKEKEYIETIMKLRCVLSEKEKENNELKNRIMNCNSKTNMTYEVSTSYD